jgi:CheY-like chemotaxis protein
MDCEGLAGTELQLCQAARAAAEAAVAAKKLAEGKEWWEVVLANLTGLSTAVLTLALIVGLWRLWPLFRAILETRKFTIKIAGFELSAQEATDQIRAQIEDLQAKVAALTPVAAVAAAAARPSRRRVLWVDDRPANNAALIASFEEAGALIDQEVSTDGALARLRGGRAVYDAVVTDMGRTEAGRFDARAGIRLVETIRADKLAVPVAVFTSSRGAARAAEAAEAGASLVTTSATDLRRFVLGEGS